MSDVTGTVEQTIVANGNGMALFANWTKDTFTGTATLSAPDEPDAPEVSVAVTTTYNWAAQQYSVTGGGLQTVAAGLTAEIASSLNGPQCYGYNSTDHAVRLVATLSGTTTPNPDPGSGGGSGTPGGRHH